MTFIRTVTNILVRYKLFSAILAVILFFLLIRIPLGTFHYPSSIDTAAHFLLPAVSAPLITELLVRLGYLPKLGRKSSMIIYVLIATFIEVSWEILEYFIDLTLDWNWQLSNGDTMMDIILAVIGGIVGGAVFLAVYRNKP